VRAFASFVLFLFLIKPSMADENTVFSMFRDFSPKVIKKILSRLEDREVIGGSRLSNKVFAVYPSLSVYPYPKWGIVVTTSEGWIDRVIIKQDSREVFNKNFTSSKKKIRFVELPALDPGFYEIEVVLSQCDGKKIINVKEVDNFEIISISPNLKAKLDEFKNSLKRKQLSPCDRYLAWAAFFEELNLEDDEFDFTYNRDFLLSFYRICKTK